MIGKPMDRSLWLMTPQTVNAYYWPNQNEIVFSAAILQPPGFGPAADDALNYGAIGSVIGHGLIHGYDDQGSRFGPTGNSNNRRSADHRRPEESRGRKERRGTGYTAGTRLHKKK